MPTRINQRRNRFRESSSGPRKRQAVGLIGLGLMGTAMAERALAADCDVVGFDLLEVRQTALAKLGGTPVDSVSEVARRAKVLVFAVMTTAQVDESILAMGNALRRGSLIVDTTTGSPTAMMELARQLAARRVGYIDACVAGNSEQLRAGDVIVLAGGAKSHVAKASGFLSLFAKNVIQCGPVGSGARMKLVVNLALGLHRAVLAEALEFAAAIDVDRDRALEALMLGPAHSRVMETKGRKMIDRDFRPQAKLAQHLKDVQLIIAMAKEVGAQTPLTEVHQTLLARLVDAGHAELDNCAIIDAFRTK